MRILQVYKTFYPDVVGGGGVENLIQLLSVELYNRNYISDILISSREPNKNLDNFPCKLIKKKTSFEIASCPFSFQMFLDYRRIVKRYDVVHVHIPFPFAELLTILFLPKNVKLLVTYHCDIVKQKTLKKLYFPILNRFLKRADVIVATSDNLINTSETLRPYKDKCVAIPCMLDEPKKADEACLNKWKDRFGENFLLFIGRFRHYKGLKVLLNACKFFPHKVVLVGGGFEEEELKQLANKLKLENVYFAGSLPDADKNALLELCHAVVMPSINRAEGFGISLLEGLAFSKPLISTELGTGTSFVNQDGVTGIVIPPNDVDALVDAINRLFENPGLVKSMSKNSRLHYDNLFTANKVVDMYVNCYEKILSGDCGARLKP